MKTRNILIAVVLLLVVNLGACGAENPLLGTWKGSYDVTALVKEIYTPSLTASDKEMAEHIQFEALTIDIAFAFTEENITISVDEASKEALRASIEKNLVAIYNAYMEANASKAEMTLDELYAANETTKEEDEAKFLKGMKVEQVADVVVGAFQVSGNYDYDEEVITIIYPDNTWEKMKYAFNEEQLTVTISSGENEFPVTCNKAE